MNERCQLMKQIMEYSFAAHDWNLYLNTHPNDRMALRFFKEMSKKAMELKKIYAEKYGPITVSDVNNDQEWTWINEPWPWSV
ncbi:MAG: spore coat protein CotJB [Clostridia bacterium]|nr:spore coat protein CotJB [Clostridia bacterium]